MSDARWTALVLEVPRSLEDEVAGILGAGSLGVVCHPLDADRARLTIYLTSPGDAEILAERSLEQRRVWGVPAGAWRQSFEPVEDLRWAETYQASLRPFRVGARFTVVPGVESAMEAGRLALYLVPGMAFGTGEHPTTRLCVDALERTVAPGSSWLDLGCGSGILSLVAARCGAASVRARDTDPEAVSVAREVVRTNAVESTVQVELGSAEDLAGCGFDGVVANIAAEFFATRAADLTAVLRPGGIAVTAGFLAEASGTVEQALARAGLTPTESCDSDGWGCWVARRGAAER